MKNKLSILVRNCDLAVMGEIPNFPGALSISLTPLCILADKFILCN